MEGSKAFFKQATVAQLVEQLIRNQQVRGSSPLSSFFDGGKPSKIVEAWLSLVERCVRDAEVASSNLVASMIPAYWSSGQDAALSRRKPGFDSRIGHIIVRKRHCLVRTVPFFALGNQTEDCGSDVNRNIIRKLNIAVPEITVV